MEDITLDQVIVGVLGFAMRWLGHLHRSRIKNKEQFSYPKYWSANYVLILFCLFGTTALIYLSSVVVDYFDGSEDAVNIASFASGLMSLEIVEAFKNKVWEKLKPSRNARK